MQDAGRRSSLIDFSELVSLPIVDGHVHFIHPESMGDILTVLDQTGCVQANCVCLPDPDGTTGNAIASAFKAHHPDRVCLSGALEYGAALALALYLTSEKTL